MNFPPKISAENLQVTLQLTCDFATTSAKRETSLRQERFAEALKHSIRAQGGKHVHQVMRRRDQPEVTSVCVHAPLRWRHLRRRVKGSALIRVQVLQSIKPPVKICANGLPIQPQSPLTPDVFALPPQLLPGEGLHVSQSHWAYDPNSIHDAFFRHWSTYWERDDSDLGIPSGLHLLDGVTLRGCDFSITAQELRDSISSTKTSTCVVADGWAQPEMAALCAPMLDELTVLWNDIFLHGQQVPDCFGRATINDCRPITVLSLIYRTCMKALVRKLIAFISSSVPHTVVGGLPGRSCADIFYSLQMVIETAAQRGVRLGGAVTDGVKMFNALPRPFVRAVLVHVGVPDTVADAWFRILGTYRRHLLVSGCISTGHRSSAGLPEGCPMSVLSAILVGALWCGKVKETPGVVPQAFIDNWEIVSNTAGAIETAFLATSTFAQEWRIALDVEKSWCWTLNFSKDDETRLCDLGLTRRSAAKDLGAVIKYGKNMSNRPLQNRVTEGIARLLRLAPLPLSKTDKANIILANAFPTAFFGCEITLLGQNHFQAVRSAVVNVMLRRHRRASPEGACLAFGKGDLDPFVWTVLRVLRQCRSFFATRDPEWQAFVEMTQVPFTAKTKVYGPAGVLKRYLQVMSLSVEADGTIVFRNQARLHLLRCCYAELRNAVCEAWDDTVLARLRQRSGA